MLSSFLVIILSNSMIDCQRMNSLYYNYNTNSNERSMMSLISLNYTDTTNDKNERKVLEFSEDLLPSSIKKESLFVVKVEGISMQPVIKDGTLVIGDLSQRELIDENIYLIYKDNKMWIKKLKKFKNDITFISINEDFSHLVYKEEEVRVIAKVVLSLNVFN